MKHRRTNSCWALPAQLLVWGLLVRLATSPAVFAAEGSWLTAKGNDLVDPQGHAVVLRGVSLGGWLVEEMWMQPIATSPPSGSGLPAVQDHVSLWHVVQQRLGEGAMRRVRTAFREAWINESDFERLHRAGFNSARLPFLYDLLDEPEGLAWLDRALEWAGKRGMYVILDLHGAPGGQSSDHHTGQANQNRFFKDPRHIEHAERVWQTVARRYSDRAEVAAFDILNEPMGAPDLPTLYLVQDRLYRAIRQVDRKHAIIIEDGYTGLDHMPVPEVAGWTNVVMSCHHYVFKASSEQQQREGARGHIDYMGRNQEKLRCPLFLGEFNQEPHGTPQSIAAFTRDLEKHGWSWSLWTYKAMSARGTRSMWSIYRNPQAVDPLDPYHDSEQQLIKKCQQMLTERLEPYPGLLEALGRNERR